MAVVLCRRWCLDIGDRSRVPMLCVMVCNHLANHLGRLGLLPSLSGIQIWYKSRAGMPSAPRLYVLLSLIVFTTDGENNPNGILPDRLYYANFKLRKRLRQQRLFLSAARTDNDHAATAATLWHQQREQLVERGCHWSGRLTLS